jgi:hypothetical protein
MELLQWWNLIFLLPAVAALLYLLLLALGALPAEGGHGDIHAEPGLHVEVHGAHIEIHPHDVPDDFGHDTDHDTDPFRGALSLIGVGRIPLSLVMMSFLFLWGFFGWAANQLFSGLLPSPALFIWPSLAVALVGAGAFTRLLAVRLGRLMPSTESYGASSSELVGRIADVRYALTETTGTVQLYDRYGTMYEVSARVMPGEQPIPSGERVVLWRYDGGAGTYFAVQDDVIAGIEPGGAHLARLPIR